MALSSSGMKTAIKAEMASRGFNIDHPDTDGEADAYLDALCAGIISHITANAQVVDAGTTGNPAGAWPII